MFQYDTVSEAVNGLRDRGYTVDFNIKDEWLVCNEPPCRLAPREFEISEFHRFEGPSDPADEAVVYAIESQDHNLKGVLVNGYGPTADKLSSELVAKLRVHPAEQA